MSNVPCGFDIYLKFGLSEKHTKFEKIFLMVLTNQLIYLIDVKTMRKIFFQIMCGSQKVRTLNIKTKRKIAQIFVAFSEKLNFTKFGLLFSSKFFQEKKIGKT